MTALDEIWLVILILAAVIVITITVFISIKSVGLTKKRHNHLKIKKNKISDEFKEMYEYIVHTYAKELEENRKKLLKSLMVCIILFLITTSIVILIFDKLNIDLNKRSGWYIFLLYLPTIFYYTHEYKKYNDIYRKNYKMKVIKNFVEHINPSLTYTPTGAKWLLDYYLDAKFDEESFNKFVTDDYIVGRNKDGSSIEISDIALENVNEKGEFLKLFYAGIFSVSTINKNLPNEVRIKKNKNLFYGKSQNQVEMDSNEFEKYFDVFSDSNILSMELLTHDIMQLIVEFYKNYKINFEIVLKENNIYIRFDTGAMFEPNILKKSSDMRTLWIYYRVLKFVTSFTIKMNKVVNDADI